MTKKSGGIVIGGLNVSRETVERLYLYEALLKKWNPRINLVAKTTLPEAWSRHFIDSVQLWEFVSTIDGGWADLGSGAGFPGLVAAIVASELAPNMHFTLVESDTRKCAFLQTVSRQCGVPVRVLPDRIERLKPLGVSILTARALAPLAKLLEFAEKHRDPRGICLFPKGEKVHKEIEEAQSIWRFDYRLHPSRTEPKAAIVEIGVLSRA